MSCLNNLKYLQMTIIDFLYGMYPIIKIVLQAHSKETKYPTYKARADIWVTLKQNKTKSSWAARSPSPANARCNATLQRDLPCLQSPSCVQEPRLAASVIHAPDAVLDLPRELVLGPSIVEVHRDVARAVHAPEPVPNGLPGLAQDLGAVDEELETGALLREPVHDELHCFRPVTEVDQAGSPRYDLEKTDHVVKISLVFLLLLSLERGDYLLS